MIMLCHRMCSCLRSLLFSSEAINSTLFCLLLRIPSLACQSPWRP